ncbi:MAG TPA: type I methionyl aminopeptidase, partial [Candidatus Acetothermia bacterium]|nr:type I methionyl aminopeptidase [Candidatus Acetothermia bacterium]
MIPLKTEAELDIMRENGRILALILAELCAEVRPGRETLFFDRLAEE